MVMMPRVRVRGAGRRGTLDAPVWGATNRRQLLVSGRGRMDMTERFDAHNISIDEQLAREGACAQIHLPSGRTCGLPLHHHGSCLFLHAANSPAPARRRHLPRRSSPGS